MDAQACWVFALSKNPRCDAHPSGCGVKRSMLGFCPKQKHKMQARQSMRSPTRTADAKRGLRLVFTQRGASGAKTEVASIEGGDIKYPPSLPLQGGQKPNMFASRKSIDAPLLWLRGGGHKVPPP
jgi:hypothetical protein